MQRIYGDICTGDSGWGGVTLQVSQRMKHTCKSLWPAFRLHGMCPGSARATCPLCKTLPDSRSTRMRMLKHNSKLAGLQDMGTAHALWQPACPCGGCPTGCSASRAPTVVVSGLGRLVARGLGSRGGQLRKCGSRVLHLSVSRLPR